MDRRQRMAKGNGQGRRPLRADLRQVRRHAGGGSGQGPAGVENGRAPVRLQLLGLPSLCDTNVFILRKMDHSLSTVTEVKLAEISQFEFQEIMENSPRISQALWWSELVTVATQREWTTNIGQRTAYERIAHLFCEIFMRLRTIGQTDAKGCEFPMTQAEIAEATGLTQVHVNRTIQDLRRNQLIELRGRRLQVLDLGRLEKAAMFNPNYLHLGHEGSFIDANY